MSLYSLPAYGRMVGDPRRFGAYRRALEAVTRPGSTVLDLGAGPGVLALTAARLGAARVWAIDPDPSIEVAAALAERNGLGPIVRARRMLSTDLTLDPLADVIVSDLRGVLPFFGRHLPSIIDARERLLASDGVLIPAADELWVAPVHAPILHDHLLAGFDQGPPGLEPPLDLGPARELASHHWCRAELEADACLRPPRRLGRLDYPTIESPHFEGSAEWPGVASAPSTEGSETAAMPCHGLAIWFDCRLLPEASIPDRPSARGAAEASGDLEDPFSFSNAPSRHLLYGQAFFPLPEPRALDPAADLRVRFDAHLVGDDYVFGWSVEVQEPGREAYRVRRSTFHANPIDPRDLIHRSAAYRPGSTDEYRMAAALLSKVNGRTTLGELAEGLMIEYPQRFANLGLAMTFASDLLRFVGGSHREPDAERGEASSTAAK